ncbi:MAG TPA: biotin/lipoyl-containing protein, partial [Acidimicrobiia bacterium]|nr:biotin/lipoyl-containing protein [Acidimicrobiia bacterium]
MACMMPPPGRGGHPWRRGSVSPPVPRDRTASSPLDLRCPDGGHYAQQTDGRHAADPSGGPANVAKVTMPQLGESVAEGTIGKWLKQPGDHVDKYEPLVEVVTDKVNAEVPSPFEGILREILVEEGATVPNNAEIAVIETADDGAADTTAAGATGAVVTAAAGPVAAAAEPTPTPTPAAAPTPAVAGGPAGSDERGPAELAPAATAAATAQAAPTATQAGTAAAATSVVAASAAPPIADPDARMTPAVRRLLREHDLSPAQIHGTGGGGRITREDVLQVVESIRTGTPAPAPVATQAGQNGSGQAAVSAQATPAATAAASAPATALVGPAGAPIEFPPGADEVLLPMTQMRKGIAAQMTRALAVPHAYVHMEVDAGSLVRARETA